MSDARLNDLAQRAGVAIRWQNVHGRTHDVAPPTLRAVLRALDLPADTEEELKGSLARVNGGQPELPPLVTADVGQPVHVPALPGRYQVVLEDGTGRDGTAEAVEGGAVLPAIEVAGYHRLQIGTQATLLAVAPPKCFQVGNAAPGRRPWGLAVQLYALRRPGAGCLGDFGSLGQFVRLAARNGAAAVAISPVHAQFSADPNRFSP